MSWFDAAGLASLAKNALKEAQKQIDKALDIKDENLSSSPPHQQNQNPPTADVSKCKTEPSTPIEPVRQSASHPVLWSSFSGSFFDNPKASEMVTTPPKGGTKSVDSSRKRESVHSNSDSVEILSPPTTPCSGSGLTSPSVTVYNSESVEVITTPTSSELLSPDSAKTPDSIEVITSDEMVEEDDESMSFSTVMDDSVVPVAVAVVTVPPSKNVALLEETDSSSQNISLQSNDSIETIKSSSEIITPVPKQSVPIASDDILLDSQTYLSDSTQSFEEVHIPESSSDKEMVKISSGPNSGHTSADEVETTTSSDIEIISNPNGDSSSTNSAYRSSPMKQQSSSDKKETACEVKIGKKGHCRGPSEVSMNSDDSQLSSQSEVEKLLRRISELSEVLETREFRLMEMGRQNAELQAKNSEYKEMLEARQKKGEYIETEEYTQRLSALEKKFQMSIRERDSIREQLKTVRAELATRLSKEELEKTISEKDFIIDELKGEGEKLSKQILQHSNAIKKLRAKERETDSLLKKSRDQIEEFTEEVERLRKSLSAKEEFERSQTDAVHKLSADKRKLDKENQAMKSQLEDLISKLETVQTSFEAVKKELQDKKDAQSELSKKTDALAILESEKQLAQSQNIEILSQLEDCREKLRIAETGNTVREQKLRQENADLLRRLESVELRAEQLTQEVSLATIPFARQLEALQTTLKTRTYTWEKQEKELVTKLEEAKEKLKNLENIDVEKVEMENSLNTRVKSLEERLSASLMRAEQSGSLLHQAEVSFSLKEAEYQKDLEKLRIQLEENLEIVEEFRQKCNSLQKSMELVEETRRKQLTEMRLNRDKTPEESITMEANDDLQQNSGGNSSPTLSLGRNSLADSLGSSAWQMDDLDCISLSGRQQGTAGSFYGLSNSFGPISHTTSIMENLQSSLKQRDGEVHQLQWEMSRLQSERSVLNTNICNLTLELENVNEKLSTYESLEKEFGVLQHQYDALLQMYGEKVEETQELELDLQDVKEMYKAQIDELLRQQNSV